jgi:site-specific recombinase XerD
MEMKNLSQKRKDEILNKPYIKQFREALVEQKRQKKIRLSEASMFSYCYEVCAFYKYLGLELDQKPTLEQAEKWRQWAIEKYSRKTAARQLSGINHFLHLCCGYSRGVLEPVPNVSRQKTPIRLSTETVMEAVRLLESKAKYTESCLVFTAFVTASRKGTLHKIRLSDLDFENSIVTLRECKGNLDHKVPMNSDDMAIIKDYIDNLRPEPIKGHEDYLFITSRGKKVAEDRLRDVLRYCGRHLDLKQRIHPHALRRARILDLRQKGYQWEEIMQITGHRDISSLLAYIQEEDFEKVHEKLNNGTSESEPQPVISQKSDIDKEMELYRTKLEYERMKSENLHTQQSLRKDTTIQSDVGQTGYY